MRPTPPPLQSLVACAIALCLSACSSSRSEVWVLDGGPYYANAGARAFLKTSQLLTAFKSEIVFTDAGGKRTLEGRRLVREADQLLLESRACEREPVYETSPRSPLVYDNAPGPRGYFGVPCVATIVSVKPLVLIVSDGFIVHEPDYALRGQELLRLGSGVRVGRSGPIGDNLRMVFRRASQCVQVPLELERQSVTMREGSLTVTLKGDRWQVESP